MRTRLEDSSTPTGGPARVAREMARLTERDLLLLRLLDEHQVLTTAQLAALLFGSSSRTIQRARLLYQRGVLQRFRRWVANGSAPWHWVIGPVGAAILAAASDTPAPRPATLRERVDRLAASPKLGHLVGTNGFFVALSAYARDRDGVSLSAWWPERQATAACADVARPDGGGVWSENGRTVAFWLEFDTGTERPISRVTGKLTGYGHLAGTGAARPVLFWFPSTIRETNFAVALSREPVPVGVVVATASADYADTAGGPAGAVWSVAGRAARVRLAEIGPSGGTSWDG